jgi:hypothetical protein
MTALFDRSVLPMVLWNFLQSFDWMVDVLELYGN